MKPNSQPGLISRPWRTFEVPHFAMHRPYGSYTEYILDYSIHNTYTAATCAGKMPAMAKSTTKYTIMKKTLIALLALGGVSMAATVDSLNDTLQNELTSTAYKVGDQYTLTFTLKLQDGSTTGSIFKLTDSAYFVTQIGHFGAINTAPNNTSVDGWVPAGTPVSEGNRIINTITTTSEENSKWFTLAQDGSTGKAKGLNNTAITLAYDGHDTTLTIDYAGATYNKDLINKYVWKEISFDANNFAFQAANVDSVFGSLVVNHSVPEPTTGTLSLLALAGLCARRRKK